MGLVIPFFFFFWCSSTQRTRENIRRRVSEIFSFFFLHIKIYTYCTLLLPTYTNVSQHISRCVEETRRRILEYLLYNTLFCHPCWDTILFSRIWAIQNPELIRLLLGTLLSLLPHQRRNYIAYEACKLYQELYLSLRDPEVAHAWGAGPYWGEEARGPRSPHSGGPPLFTTIYTIYIGEYNKIVKCHYRSFFLGVISTHSFL